MSQDQAAQGGFDPGSQPSEEELRARLEEELKRIRVEDVLVQSVITLINLAGQRLGLSEQTREGRDLGQARTAIEAVRALLPIVDTDGGEELRPLRDALAQLQMAYAREAGAAPAPPEGPGDSAGGAESSPAPPRGEAPPPPRRGGGLWVPPGSGE
jgi:hypothetical protein